jgi:hypothetical protein
MKIRRALPVLFCLVLSPRAASPEGPPDAGVSGESMPLLRAIPEEKSKTPTLAEWNAATDIGGKFAEASSCKLRRVREWLRFRCEGENGLGVELLAGTKTEVAFLNTVDEGTCTKVPLEQPYLAPICKTKVELVFPIRRGDRRFFQIVRRRERNRWNVMVGFQPAVAVEATLSAAWVEDEPSPVVVTKQYEL